MGSVDTAPEELTILVTGFGPFKEQYPQNPSWEIVSSLPDYLPPSSAKDIAARQQAQETTSTPRRVRIVTPPEAIRVNYDVVRKMVPSFWDTDNNTFSTTPQDEPNSTIAGNDDDDDDDDNSNSRNSSKGEHKYDFVLHIGMAGPQPMYQLERRGHRDGYRLRDVDGKLLDDDERHKSQGDKWIWHGVPEELLTDLDIEKVFEKWVARSPKVDGTTLRISEDPGRYLCDFIYFSSLAHLWKQGKQRDVLFLHVPAFADPTTVAHGRELVLQLLRSIVEVHFGA